jgi:hypothetical protein
MKIGNINSPPKEQFPTFLVKLKILKSYPCNAAGTKCYASTFLLLILDGVL